MCPFINLYCSSDQFKGIHEFHFDWNSLDIYATGYGVIRFVQLYVNYQTYLVHPIYSDISYEWYYKLMNKFNELFVEFIEKATGSVYQIQTEQDD